MSPDVYRKNIVAASTKSMENATMLTYNQYAWNNQTYRLRSGGWSNEF